ncbi:MAG: glycosyltransferase family 2 protein, partial [Alphaproteobacteria bacterium]
ILTFNARELALQCLQSVSRVTTPNLTVVVVDNASSDGTYEALVEANFNIRLICNQENLGFAGGNNVGIRMALREGADYVVLLNQDTVVDPAFIDELVAQAEADRRAGFVCSKIYFLDQPNILWFAGATFNTMTGRNRHIGHGQLDTGQYDHVREIARPCGCSLLITRELLDQVGVMEEKYFLYCEEIDWMLRARKKGFVAVMAPKSKVWHKVSPGMGGERSGNIIYYVTRNLLDCLDKNHPFRFPFASDLRTLLVLAVIFLSLFTMKISKTTGLRNLARGYLDYKKGRFGMKNH